MHWQKENTMSKQNELLKELVAVRIKRVLARTGTQYERNFYNRVGRGVTPLEYVEVVEKLIADGVVRRTSSERNVSILSLVEQAEVGANVANNLNHQ
jgi:hypothetical protein